MPKSRVRKGRRKYEPKSAVVPGRFGQPLADLGSWGAQDDVPDLPLPPVPSEVSTYQVRVDLEGAKPPIWRRLELAGDVRLDELHLVLQLAMGWENSHLHAFRHPDDDRRSFRTDYDDAMGDGAGTDEADVRLDQVLREVGGRLRYDYDFGDGWSHVIALESTRPRLDTDRIARCLGGRRACPPEDIGGIWAYNDLVPTLTGESGAEPLDVDLQEWLGDFDPAAFDLQETDRRLRRI